MIKTTQGAESESEFYKMLQDQKEIAESQFVFSLYSNISYYFDYQAKPAWFNSSIWRFYYNMLSEMVQQKKIKVIDEVSVAAYVEGKSDRFKEVYNMAGGFKTIQNGMDIIEPENVESYLYTIQKYRVLMRLVDQDFPIERNWKTYQNMDIEEISDALEGILSDTFLDTQFSKAKAVNMFADMDKLLDEADRGEARGLPIASPLMDNIQNGLTLGKLTMMAAYSGVGKTFLTLMLHIVGCVLNHEPVLVIANEEERKTYAFGLYTAYINKKYPDANFNKDRFTNGHFTQQEWAWIREAKQWYDEQCDDGMILYEGMPEFSMDSAIHNIKKYATLYDIKYFIIDTLKADNDRGVKMDENIWFQLQQNMVRLDNTIRKDTGLNVHVWITAQLNKNKKRTRYLDQSMIGMSKNMVDVLSSLMLVRMLSLDEKSGSNAIRVIDDSGHGVVLDEDKDYMLVFWDKNRQGKVNRQVVLEVDKGLNTVKDIGLTQIDNDLE